MRARVEKWTSWAGTSPMDNTKITEELDLQAHIYSVTPNKKKKTNG